MAFLEGDRSVEITSVATVLNGYICPMEHGMVYNTQEVPMVLGEYGRIIQMMVGRLMEVDDREKRTKLAEGIVQVMISLNPQVKELDNYEQKLWDHLQIISEYALDIDSPYPTPVQEEVNQKPNPIPYKDELIKFRFYGRNLQHMVEQANDLEDGDVRRALMNYIASFMVNSSRNWNDENLDKNTVIQHMKMLSKGQLNLQEDDLEIYIEKGGNRPRNNNSNNNNRNKNFKKKKPRKNR
ncbi:MAG: DUF4290 domain-containing protein [Flavobacteriales bacterium]|nr:DUF4290 domain-containing protein [Bacteroidota bacterium]MCB9240233.1 DUF4290 domain-containing protein [Flavobacteriales bacterium]